MSDKNVVKLVTRKVVETAVKEAVEWKQAINDYQKRNEDQAKLIEKFEQKRIGFRF
jgi:hypothetical protein